MLIHPARSLVAPGRHDRERRGVKPMPYWWRARDLARQNVRNAKVLCLGHSAVAAQGANSSVWSSNNPAYGWPAQLAAKFEHGTSQGFFGWGQRDTTPTQAEFTAYDNRINVGSWTFLYESIYDVNNGMGRCYWFTTGSSSWAFTPVGNFDTAVVYAALGVNALAQAIDIDFDGGTATNFDLANGGVLGLTSCVKTGTLDTHTVNVRRTAGTPYVNGILCYDSTRGNVVIQQAGQSGLTTAEATANTTATGYAAEFARFAPDLTILQILSNDPLQAVSINTTISNITKLIIEARKTGDVILLGDITLNGNESTVSAANYMYRQLAESFGLNYIDMNARTERSYSRYNSIGWYYDSAHFNTTGYADEAQIIYDLIGP